MNPLTAGLGSSPIAVGGNIVLLCFTKLIGPEAWFCPFHALLRILLVWNRLPSCCWHGLKSPNRMDLKLFIRNLAIRFRNHNVFILPSLTSSQVLYSSSVCFWNLKVSFRNSHIFKKYFNEIERFQNYRNL